MSTHIPQWITVRDFADLLQVSTATAYKWSSMGAASGKFPRFVKLPNGSIRIRQDWLDKWLEERVPK